MSKSVNLNQAVAAVMNLAQRRMETMFPGYFPGAKHKHYTDFSYPEHITFDMLHQMYSRNGLGKAAIILTKLKTWEDYPFVMESDEKKDRDDFTEMENDIHKRFEDLLVWQRLAEVDMRSTVGGYAGAILRLADSKRFNQPVDRVPGGLMGLVEIIPAWRGQLRADAWDTDEESENYGQPTMYTFDELAVDKTMQNGRKMEVHPDRVILWSADQTLYAESMLEAGYNGAYDCEKISGAGGEGFWKNAKGAPIIEVDGDVTPQTLAKNMGVQQSEIAEAMSDQFADFNSGLDATLMLQGMQAKPYAVDLADSTGPFGISKQMFAASIPIPDKVLTGMQTGERASTEDALAWNKTNNARRVNTVIPNIRIFIDRLERFGILSERDWFVGWSDLTESTLGDKINRAAKMAEVNAKMNYTGQAVFLGDEIRTTIDMKPLGEGEKTFDTLEDQ